MEYLKILRILYYTFAVLTFLCGSFPLIHVAIGAAMVSGAIPSAPQGGGMEAFGGMMFMAFGSLIVLLCWAMAGLLAYVGYNIAIPRRHTICIVGAGLACTSFPLGTVLGICTIIYICKPEIKALFDHNDALV